MNSLKRERESDAILRLAVAIHIMRYYVSSDCSIYVIGNMSLTEAQKRKKACHRGYVLFCKYTECENSFI